MYLLDTDICIYLLNGKYRQVTSRFTATPRSQVAISAITLAELRYGAARSKNPRENDRRIDIWTRPLTLVPFTAEIASVYAATKLALSVSGRLIGPMDLLIAATAIATGRTLVSNNTREFGRVPGLRLENWLD